MSRTVEQIKEAEARRQRVIDGRKSLGDDESPGAAMIAREREKYDRSVRFERQRWAGGAALVVSVVAGYLVFVSNERIVPTPEVPLEAHRAPSEPLLRLKLDRDLGAFAARLGGNERNEAVR